MDIYQKKTRLKLILLILAAVIIFATLFVSSRIAKKIKAQEQQRVDLIAATYQRLINSDNSQDISFLFTVIQGNKSIPLLIIDDEGNYIQSKNLSDSARVLNKPEALEKKVKKLSSLFPPLEIPLGEGKKQFLYYDNSKMYYSLKRFPLFQLTIIALFLGVSYLAFNFARRGEQNLVWVGMAKETAHQLGTPISSLGAWIENLKSMQNLDPGSQKMVDEMNHDVERLEMVADRFSKIGSEPILETCNLNEAALAAINYIKKRASEKVMFEEDFSHPEIPVKINLQLFNWVLENLLKNALDAIQGSGSILVETTLKANKAQLDVTDTGSGIPRSRFNTVFQPGFSTKKRGWGLGLSLSKRIIEQYHKGKIFVAKSTLGKGTTFRIVIPFQKELSDGKTKS